jgi:ubiquinone/menaquinone biosynthesis C-methylase UbiE
MSPTVPPARENAPVASPDHYSYRLYADPAMAEAFDTMRFSGPIGTLLADDQARVLREFVGALAGRAILDVGTGTGRAAIALASQGATVTGVDASDEMLRVARERAEALGVPAVFERGDAHHLGYADRAFDVAVCLRVIMHTPDWRACLGELCRVSRDRVVFDYPSACSAAAVQSVGRRLMAALGSGTEAYRVFRLTSIRRELESHGYRIEAVHRQFVLPIAIHKLIGSRTVTRGVEGMLARLGLLRLMGSPVSVLAVRCAS